MYFVSNHHVVLKNTMGFALTFDIRGKAISQSRDVQEQILNSDYYVVSKKHVIHDADYSRPLRMNTNISLISAGSASFKLLTTTSKLVIYEFKHEKPLKYHDAFKVVMFQKNGKGKIECDQLSH